ncbi:MAG: NAD(+)/NADH kinase [Candidatus Bipolaricaulota bacterium]
MTFRRVLVVANDTKPSAARARAELAAACARHGVECVDVAGAMDRAPGEALVVALGGDGTVLRAADAAAHLGLPVLGVNLGSLGFLSATDPEALAEAFEAVLRGEARIEDRMRLTYKARAFGGSVLNDVVVCGVGRSRFCELTVIAGGETIATFAGDGVILSTPTGSTAYNLSAGGPVVVPEAECLIVTPHAVHALGVRSTVLPASAEVRIRPRRTVEVIADGDHVGQIDDGDELLVRRSDVPTRWVRLPSAAPFFAVLAQKLGWSGDPRRARG